MKGMTKEHLCMYIHIYVTVYCDVHPYIHVHMHNHSNTWKLLVIKARLCKSVNCQMMPIFWLFLLHMFEIKRFSLNVLKGCMQINRIRNNSCFCKNKISINLREKKASPGSNYKKWKIFKVNVEMLCLDVWKYLPRS